MKCPRKGQARVLLGVVLDPQDYRRCKATETAPLLLPLASVSRAQQPVSSSREEEHLTAFIVAPAESLFAAPRGPRTLTNAAGAAGRRGHTSPGVGWGAACPDCGPVWSGLTGGVLRTAAVSSHSKLRQPRRLRSAAPKRSEPPAGRPPAGDSFRVVACGSGVRWESGPVDERYGRPLVARSRGDGGRARTGLC